MTNKDEIAELRNEVERLKAHVAPKPLPSEADVAAHRAAMHEAAERRMGCASNFSPDQLAAFEAACPTDVARDIVARGGVSPPSSHGAGNTVSAPSGAYLPNTSGWRQATPIQSPPGVKQADLLMDAQDAKDRHDLIVEEARRTAARRLAEK
jgi:hypothetical protein